MSFRKPFRAVPVKLGTHYHGRQRANDQKAAFKLLGIAAFIGAIIGAGSIALSHEGRAKIVAVVKPLAVHAGIVRAREPQSGDFWSGCDNARAAGTAPIYSGEPGYRENMDGDNDGIACEPYRGR